MIKIYGPKQSSAARTYWAAEECGVEYEMVSVDMQNKEHKSAEFLKLNPNGKVPVMVDGDLVMFESVAINMYLAEKYKLELLGKNISEHGLVYQWSVWAVANLAEAGTTLIRARRYNVPFSPDALQRAEEALTEYLGILNTFLAGKDYLVGDSFTLADLNVVSVVMVAPMFNFDLSSFPEINRWMAIHSARPALQKLTA